MSVDQTTSTSFARYLAREREEMLRHKWIESEKAGRDLGQEALFDWVKRYAGEFRRWAITDEHRQHSKPADN